MSEKNRKSTILLLLIDAILISLFVFTYGFDRFDTIKPYMILAMPILILMLLGINYYQFRSTKLHEVNHINVRFNLLLLSAICITEIVVFIINYESSFLMAYIDSKFVLEYGLFFYFVVRLAFFARLIYSLYFNPALLFVSSFALVALTGTFLLMLPTATTNGITFIDALFTATSAVTVTGLIVLDTAKDFTTFGQTIIILLIQIGGLGMLTFTSFFAYFFKSGSSFSETLYMKEILGHDKLHNVMQITMQIVVFSLFIELVGAVFIYHSLNHIDGVGTRIYSALFHAVSAYCNAGFSLASQNIMSQNFQLNYYMQWVIMGLIVFGGLGYGIASNFTQYIKKFVFNLFHRNEKLFMHRIITLNTKIVVYTTLILIFAGAAFLLVSEQQTILAVHETAFGKFTTAMFSSITSRTAGFNSVDFAAVTAPGLLFLILLMWIGASPASTGGGIKTTTFALATLNIFAVAKGKQNIEIGTRRIPKEAIQKAFAIVSISLISIGCGILFILIFNPELTLMQVAFEAFSAFSTVGLSLGITASLSTGSKLVLILLMFFGRIGLINLLIGLLRNLRTSQYTYPKEDILIT